MFRLPADLKAKREEAEVTFRMWLVGCEKGSAAGLSGRYAEHALLKFAEIKNYDQEQTRTSIGKTVAKNATPSYIHFRATLRGQRQALAENGSRPP